MQKPPTIIPADLKTGKALKSCFSKPRSKGVQNTRDLAEAGDICPGAACLKMYFLDGAHQGRRRRGPGYCPKAMNWKRCSVSSMLAWPMSICQICSQKLASTPTPSPVSFHHEARMLVYWGGPCLPLLRPLCQREKQECSKAKMRLNKGIESWQRSSLSCAEVCQAPFKNVLPLIRETAGLGVMAHFMFQMPWELLGDLYSRGHGTWRLIWKGRILMEKVVISDYKI